MNEDAKKLFKETQDLLRDKLDLNLPLSLADVDIYNQLNWAFAMDKIDFKEEQK